MAVSNTTVRAVYEGNDTEDTFAIPYDFTPTLASEQTKVYLVSPAGIATLLTEGAMADYVLDPPYDVLTNPDGPANVILTVVPETGEQVIVTRELELKQILSYITNGIFPAKSHEYALDRIVFMIQQLNDVISRNISTSPVDPPDLDLELPPIVPSAVLATNEDGDGLEWVTKDEFKGEKGDDGDIGPPGTDGADGADGADGTTLPAFTAGRVLFGDGTNIPTTLAALLYDTTNSILNTPGLTTTASVVVGGYLKRSTALAVTAFATGGQASATILTKDINRVTTVATDLDSVKLQGIATTIGAGASIFVQNDGTKILRIYPATGEYINAGAANDPVDVQPGSNVIFFAVSTTTWKSFAGGGGGGVSNLVVRTATGTIATNEDLTTIDATSGNVVLTLPAVTLKEQHTIKRLDNSTNTVTVQRAGSDTIDGATSYTIPYQYGTLKIVGIATGVWGIF